MLGRALSMHESARDVLARAASVIGADAVERYAAPAGARLDTNRDIQLSVFLTTQLHLAALQADGIDTNASLGLSLGEYSHLVHIGALTFESALALVDARGAAYDESPPGVMVTILGASRDQVDEVVAAARVRGMVVVSNYNAPTQHVLAGDAPAVERAAEQLEEKFGAHTIQTESRVPMHSPLLADVAQRFRVDLACAPWQAPRHAYVPNATGRVEPDPTPQVLIDRLFAHVTEPVRWQDSIEALAAAQPDAIFVEVGPGEILHNMLARRWLPVPRAHTDDRSHGDPAGHFRAVQQEIRDHA